MTDTWELYHQTGPDGQEWGVKIRPGYIVTGFAREDAEAVVDWQNASCRPASDILERAKAAISGGPIEITSHDEIIRQLIDEVERLLDLINKQPEEAEWMTDYHLLYSALDGPIIDAARKWHAAYRKAQNSNLIRSEGLATRIKELEVEKERLEAAFLEAKEAALWYQWECYYDHDYCRQKAREKLEKIRSGKDEN